MEELKRVRDDLLKMYTCIEFLKSRKKLKKHGLYLKVVNIRLHKVYKWYNQVYNELTNKFVSE